MLPTAISSSKPLRGDDDNPGVISCLARQQITRDGFLRQSARTGAAAKRRHADDLIPKTRHSSRGGVFGVLLEKDVGFKNYH